MAEIRGRGCFERLEASDILIKTRRLLEDTKLQKSFPVVMLYADWCAHTRLDRIGAASVLLQITERLNRHVRDSMNASINAIYDAVHSPIAFKELQGELVTLYKQFGIEISALLSPQMFRQFVGAIVDTIAGLPLEFPPNIERTHGEIRKIYDAACQVAGDDPQWIVTQCLLTNELSDTQREFYEVPDGTYLWQIRTAAGVFSCGVLYA
jgi:hypothetical protein